jgi:hypothetical protein
MVLLREVTAKENVNRNRTKKKTQQHSRNRYLYVVLKAGACRIQGKKNGSSKNVILTCTENYVSGPAMIQRHH